MKSSARKVELASAADLFSTEQERQDAKLEKIQHIPLAELYPFPDHPFSVKDDDSMKETIESTNPINREQIDEFVEIMLEVALSRTPTMKIGRDAEYPTAFVQQRFEQITSAHIEKVLDGIRENTTRVWNTRAYLLAVLFNAPSTMDNHYTMLVNHDLNGGN